MIRRWTVIGASLALGALTAFAPRAFAHRIDEYLQATLIDVSKDHVRVDLRLAPGVAVARSVLDSIDLNRDDLLSDAEQAAYATRVLTDLSLDVDGESVTLHAVDRQFADVGTLLSGSGDMRVRYEGTLRPSHGVRELSFRNTHRANMSAYLVNAIEPSDRDLRVVRQARSTDQSRYTLSYAQGTVVSFDQLVKWGLLTLGALIVLGERARAFLQSRAEPLTRLSERRSV